MPTVNMKRLSKKINNESGNCSRVTKKSSTTDNLDIFAEFKTLNVRSLKKTSSSQVHDDLAAIRRKETSRKLRNVGTLLAKGLNAKKRIALCS